MTLPAPTPSLTPFERLRGFALHYLIADTPPMAQAERARAAVGALLGLIIAGLLLLVTPTGMKWLIAPVGASSIILFALPHSPLAQPWSVLGGYLMATLSALLAAALIPFPLLAFALAVGLSIWLMTSLRCVHPPGGAMALLIIVEGVPTTERATHLMAAILINVLTILIAALLVNNLFLRRRYPHCRSAPPANLHQTGDALPTQRIGLSHKDLELAVQSLEGFVDVQEDDLVRIYNRAVDHAFERHLGLTCGDIMARDVVTVEFAHELEEAWTLLRRHRIKALPVVDRARHPIGIVTVADYLRQLDDTSAAGLAAKLQGLLKRTPGMTSEKAEVVGQIMTPKPFVALETTPISVLVRQLSDNGMHHVPVVDGNNKVVGMVTQSDLIAALYKRIALESAG